MADEISTPIYLGLSLDMAHSMTESPFFVFVVFTVFVFGINTSPIFFNPVFYAFGVLDVFEVLYYYKG